MKLSIIIPIYNAEKYLSRCLDSVMAQEWTETECILVNDGSKDQSLAICREYCQKSPLFQLVDKENGGVSSARNSGLQAAQGKYIMFLDADDFLKDNAGKVISQAMQEDTEFSAFAYDTYYDDGKSVREHIPGAENPDDYDRCMRLVYADSCFNTCWGKLFQNQKIKENNLRFDETLPIGEDYKFVAEYMKDVKKVVLLDESILAYRQHGGSAMRKYSVEKRLEFNHILYEFQSRLVSELNYKNLSAEMNNYYFRVITNLCREFSKTGKFSEIKKNMQLILADATVSKILSLVQKGSLSKLKKLEMKLLENRMVTCMAVYFKLKGKL